MNPAKKPNTDVTEHEIADISNLIITVEHYLGRYSNTMRTDIVLMQGADVMRIDVTTAQSVIAALNRAILIAESYDE